MVPRLFRIREQNGPAGQRFRRLEGAYGWDRVSAELSADGQSGDSGPMTSLFIRALQTHQWLYEHSGGLVGHRLLMGNRTLLLRTIGRRTGEARCNALTYARDGEAYLVVASNGGSPRPPGWLANVKAHPNVEVQVGRHRIQVTARATYPDDPDYARRFVLVDEVNKGRYAGYQKMTTRPLAIVEMTPR